MRRLLAWSLVATVAACAAAPPSPPSPLPVPGPSAAPVAATAPEAALDAGADGSVDASSTADATDASTDGGATAPVADADAGPTSCPADMVLVDGDYCTDLEMKCLRSTYAKQNKKTICHEFEKPTKCVGQKVHKRYCIDKYEFANKKGERPVVMKNFVEAQQICAGLDKRVCTETEWTLACEGPEYKPYPYGYARDPNKCRGDRPYRFPNKEESGMLSTHSKNRDKAEKELARLWDAVESGSQPDCVSDYGVADMPGNADELASSEKMDSPYENVTTGGPWLEGVRNQCRPKIYTHNEGFSYYYLSFRCCAEADGKPTDPRSPKQIKRGEKWKKR